MRTELTIRIRRPVEHVFRVLTTPELTPRWSRNAIEERLTSPGPVGVGSTRLAVVRTFLGRRSTNEAIVTEFEPNRRVAMRTISGPFPFRAAWSMSEKDGTTRVDWVYEFDLPRLLKPLGPLLVGMFRRTLTADLKQLRRMMEAGEL